MQYIYTEHTIPGPNGITCLLSKGICGFLNHHTLISVSVNDKMIISKIPCPNQHPIAANNFTSPPPSPEYPRIV